jgi:(p)ppGpp synthase/HD superfamily hydrolase
MSVMSNAYAQIDDLVDPNMVKQGEPGYSNPIAMAGDLILKIDGQDAQTALLADLHDMLKGETSRVFLSSSKSTVCNVCCGA